MGRRNLRMITVGEHGPAVKLKREREGDGVEMTEESFRAGESSR